jgi:hypothetical protein
MKMYFTELGEYEMNNHVVEYEPDRRIGWEPEAGRGHPMPPRRLRSRPAEGSGGPLSSLPTAGRDHRDRDLRLFWVPEDERAAIDNGGIWVDSMNRTLERLDGLCAEPPETATPG